MTEGKIECKYLRSDNLRPTVLQNDEGKIGKESRLRKRQRGYLLLAMRFPEVVRH